MATSKKAPTTRPTSRPAAPAAAKTAAKKAAPAAKRPAPKAPASAKAAKRPAAPTAKKPAAAPASAPATPVAAPAPVKPKKPKLVRDGFTFPESDYALFAQLKKRSMQLGLEVKKSELLRGGLRLLATLDDASLQKQLQAVERIKTGRPSKS